jgi:aminoglycoside 6'-N-acetyltransferase I
MRHALWADSTAEEHARELIAILEGKASSPSPTVTLVAEAGDQKLLGFLEAGLRSHADGCDPSHDSSKVGTLLKTIDSKA